MIKDLFRRVFKQNKNDAEPRATVEDSGTTVIGPLDVDYHMMTEEERPSWVDDTNFDKDLKEGIVVMDDMKVSPGLNRAKELMHTLERKEHIGGFKDELRNFSDELASKVSEINRMVGAMIERLDKYANDTNAL